MTGAFSVKEFLTGKVRKAKADPWRVAGFRWPSRPVLVLGNIAQQEVQATSTKFVPI